MMNPNKLLVFLVSLLAGFASAGCKSVRQPRAAAGPHVRVITYNVNWAAPQPDLAASIVKTSRADIVCLQETTPEWENHLRGHLAEEYPFMVFRSSQARMGGGLAYLSKTPMKEIAYIPSNTGWFDGWIVAFDTDVGRIQVMNVHLHPQVGERGGWTIGGYLGSGWKRAEEIQRFHAKLMPDLPTIVAGDFNDTDQSAPVKWLKQQGFTDALGEFDRHSATWEWNVGPIHLHRRFDHILHSPELSCCGAEVIHNGASDHFPVVAILERNANDADRSK